MTDSTIKKLLDPRMSVGVAALALAVSTYDLATDRYESSAPSSTAISIPTTVAPIDAPASVNRKHLDIETDVEVSPGTAITASGNVELGARIVPTDGCIGRYDEVTGVCVLSPGSWELHTGCYELTGDSATKCTVVVKNTGTVPLKFAGYIQVAIEGTPEP